MTSSTTTTPAVVSPGELLPLSLTGLGLMLGTALGLLRVGDGDGVADCVAELPGCLAWCFRLR